MMANGSWNNNGVTPAHHNGYTKVFYYNWAAATTISTGQSITLLNAAQNTNSFYRINTTTTNEFFFLENREKHLFDAYIPGSGMIIYHVHSNIATRFNNNNINATHPQMMYPVSQNATSDPNSTPSSYDTINSASCAWTGSGKTAFTDTSTPSSKSWAGANTAKPITNISRNATTKTVSFTFMGGPQTSSVISVTPASLSQNLQSNQTANSTLTVGNTGNATLNFNVAIQNLSSKSSDNTAIKPIYGTGSAIEEIATDQGSPLPAPQGVKYMCASGTNAILFDNGPFVNNPGAGPGGSDLSQLHSGMTTFGPAMNYANTTGPFTLADDFTITGNPWNVESFTFYAYQTITTNPTPPVSTITSGRMRIWNGLPSNPASQVVYGDMTVNAMTSTSWTNAYRVSETTVNNQRAIMKVVCSTPGLVLQHGQYWVEWSATGSTTSGPWGVPVTINGQTTTGDAIQFNTSTSTWSPLLMGGTNTPYGMSFLVEGTATTPQP